MKNLMLNEDWTEGGPKRVWKMNGLLTELRKWCGPSLNEYVKKKWFESFPLSIHIQRIVAEFMTDTEGNKKSVNWKRMFEIKRTIPNGQKWKISPSFRCAISIRNMSNWTIRICHDKPHEEGGFENDRMIDVIDRSRRRRQWAQNQNGKKPKNRESWTNDQRRKQRRKLLWRRVVGDSAWLPMRSHNQLINN